MEMNMINYLGYENWTEVAQYRLKIYILNFNVFITGLLI